MRVFRDVFRAPAPERGAVVAIGNFDGVHRGHQAVIAAAKAIALEVEAPTSILTFEPHPVLLFRPEREPERLTAFRAKARLLAETGIASLAVARFTRAFSGLSAEAFIARVLVEGLGARHVVVGENFIFGQGRRGNPTLLADAAGRHGFGMTVVAPVGGASAYSSTRARSLLQAGEVQEAAAILGRDWEIEGRVAHGDARGRRLGFPTANVCLGSYLRPKAGVYAVSAGIAGAGGVTWVPAVANFGRRPTFDGKDQLLEVHLFDFAGDLYGRSLRVAFVQRIRDERKFDGLDALTRQIAADCDGARRLHAERRERALARAS
ncbi:MAG: bifunctional riboflavin kinase/FAD synthetase [Alphaproteobacteria bacterium]|nr:bifunctional riboflavin kinase/FAD synthetase [Alphaproteobacteria bacterium]